ncbi:aldo/keto reductase [uncultured Nitrospira sp.]|uniref:aldo/keto reductase n=1 Tax=uncultured Nitrospira sp. TaxID=157176 RepID=UPI0031409317
MKKKYPISRRDFIKLSGAVAAGAIFFPLGVCFSDKAPAPLVRDFGRMKTKVTTVGLGGQASIQWTPDDVDPVSIILKAFELGVNYFDTSNMYGPSQLNYHKAFENLNLLPDSKPYNRKLRESFTLTSKTLMRWGKPGWTPVENVRNASNGNDVQCAIDDLKRSLSQIFGDGKGNYPEGSYLDLLLVHSITSFEEVDVLYKGLETPLNPDENFGALVALRDYRDGTNMTGTNPKNEKLIKHIGFSGHNNPPAMIDMIQRDEFDLLDAMLVSINSNDKLYFNMSNNVIPIAKAKGLGIIGMKVFADAAMYHKEPRFSKTPADVYCKVGSPTLPSNELIEYVLSSPDIDTLIIGIGHIDEDPLKCQLTQNYYAAQILPDTLSIADRFRIEEKTAKIRNGRTNFFQLDKIDLTSPRDIKRENFNGKTKISWHTAYAAAAPISHYEILVDNKVIGKVKHKPQIRKSSPFVFETEELNTGNLIVYAVDEAGNKA